MHCQIPAIILAFTSALVAGAPSPPQNEISARKVLYTTKNGVTVGLDQRAVDDRSKRTVLYTTKSGVQVGTLSDDDLDSEAPGLVAREDWNDADAPEVDVYDEDSGLTIKKRSGISSCGPTSGWMPIYDYQYSGSDKMGYQHAAQLFCRRVYTDDLGNPFLVPSKGYAASNVVFEFEFANEGRRVTLKNNVVGYIECKFLWLPASWAGYL